MLCLLPNELIINILYYCNTKDLKNCRELSIDYKTKVDIIINKLIYFLCDKYYQGLKYNEDWKANTVSSLFTLHELTTSRVILLRGFIAYSFIINNRKWKRCHDSRRDRGYFASVYYQGEVYAIGTYSLFAAGTVERYNPFIDNWQTVQSLPHKVRSVGTAVLNNKLYVCGGIEAHTESVRSSIYLFEEIENTSNHSLRRIQRWLTLDYQLLRPRYRHACIDYQGHIWVAGGCFDDLTITNTVEIIDPINKRVYPGPSMLVKRDFSNLLIVKGKLYAVGGDIDDLGNLSKRTIEMYDDIKKKWIHVVEFPSYRRGFSTCAYDGLIYVFGGCIDNVIIPEENINFNPYNQHLNSEDHDDFIRNTWDAFDTISKQWLSLKYQNSNNIIKEMSMPVIDSWGQCCTFPPDQITWEL